MEKINKNQISNFKPEWTKATNNNSQAFDRGKIYESLNEAIRKLYNHMKRNCADYLIKPIQSGIKY
jgi:hypothetical protein